VCGSATTTRSIFGGFRFLGDKYYRLRCEDCGFIFVDPIPTGSTFAAMYDDDYFADYYGGGDGVGYESSADASIVRADAILGRVARHVPSGSLLDIGCAGGYFLAAANKRGYAGLGIELNPRMAEHARKTFGLDVLQGSFESTAIESSGRRFDVIYMGDSLEHLPDPRAALARVRKVLAPGGVFVLNGPMTLNQSLFTAVLRLKLILGKGRTDWYVDGPPHHLWEWDARTMRRFLVGSGFDVLEFVTSEEPGRPKKVVSDALKRPLTLAETAALGLKDLSAWSTKTLFSGLEWGDRVVAISRAGVDNAV
jgi:SAM-dependent methyltransferase